jgi:hypothetical protein
MFVDPTGRIIDEGRDIYEDIQIDLHKKSEELNKNIKDIKAKLTLAKNLGDKKKMEGLGKELAIAGKNLGEVRTLSSHLATVDASEQVYNLREGKLSGTTGGKIEMDIKSREINITFDRSKGSALAICSEELEHAYQYENYDLSFGRTGQSGMLYDRTDEVAGNNVYEMMTGSSKRWTVDNVGNLSEDYLDRSPYPRSLNMPYSFDTDETYKELFISWNRSAVAHGKPIRQYFKGWR